MSDTNGIPSAPDGPPPGAPGSPEMPIAPPPAATPPQMPDFGAARMPEEVAAPKPMNAAGRTVLILWIAVAAVILVAAVFIASQVIQGFSQFGQPGGDGSSCTFTGEPSDQQMQDCLDGMESSTP